MNTQLNKTLKAISPELFKFVRQMEKTYNADADITISKIDRLLLLNQGEIEEFSDHIFVKPKGLLHSLHSRCCFALFSNSPDKLIAIPPQKRVDFEIIEYGLSAMDFLIDREQVADLKAIVHVDAYQNFNYLPIQAHLQWFKIQIATPKQNKSVMELVQNEAWQRETMKEIQGWIR